MTTRVLTLADKEEWERTMRDLPEKYRDVFYLPEYYSLFETERSKAECFVYNENGVTVMYPYLKTGINGFINCDLGQDYFDVEGAYGYNGIISNSDSEESIINFSDHFSRYCLENNIIAEFTRFNPVIQNHIYAKNLDIRIENKNVIVDLEMPEETLWTQSYEHSARKNINKAKRNGLKVLFFYGSQMDRHWIDAFYSIYISTMQRNDADQTYYFPVSFFLTINESLNDNSLFVFTLTPDEKPISAEVILLSKDQAYSYLGGTLNEYYEFRPNNILKHEAILFLQKLGIRKFCLGGGISPLDGIFKYKLTFAKKGVTDFYIGKKVHIPELYQKVCHEWEKAFPEKARNYPNYFLKYRL